METLDEVNRQGRERLYPSLMNPSWLVLRKRREIFRRWLSGLDGGGLAVLDVGGRIQPYRPLLEGRLRTYVAVDLRQSPLVDIVASGAQMPLASGVFDLVLCSQVLEYVPNPETFIAEVYRVLKPGGSLMLSAPAVFPRDSEQDSWRFLPQSLRILLHPFREVEIAPEGTSIAGFFRTINACLNVFARFQAVRLVFRCTVCPILNLSGALLELISDSGNDQFAANYSALARK
jgi:SAM-dependent methyltransferase